MLVDDATAASLTGNRSLLATLATEIKVIDTPIEYTALQRSRVTSRLVFASMSW